MRLVLKPVLPAILLICMADLPLAEAQEAKTFVFTLSGGKLHEGPKVVRVQKGDRVALVWRSDKPVEIHLHGYDKLVRVTPPEAGTMAFEATATGRFPVSLHGGEGASHSHKPLTYFEVHPK